MTNERPHNICPQDRNTSTDGPIGSCLPSPHPPLPPPPPPPPHHGPHPGVAAAAAAAAMAHGLGHAFNESMKVSLQNIYQWYFTSLDNVIQHHDTILYLKKAELGMV